MPSYKRTYRKKRTVKKRGTKKRYTKKRGRYSRKGGRRANIRKTNTYTGSETIYYSTFQTDSYTSQNVRFDPVQLPRFTALSPSFKHFKFTNATLRIVPRLHKQGWYNVSALNNNSNKIITWANKDGQISNLPVDRGEAMLHPAARVHNMQGTVTRSFVPNCIKLVDLVYQDNNDTKAMVTFTNPWLDTEDANSYVIDRSAIGYYAPPLENAASSVPIALGYDVYIDVKYALKGVNHITA